MADFVLVHGGSRDQDVWSEVRRGLESAGHRVVCPSLPDAATSTFDAHVATVCGAARANNCSSIRLVGHSYGGLVITVANEQIRDLVDRLVYLDTAYPVPGKSLFDLATSVDVDPREVTDPDPPFVTPLEFDTEIWAAVPKLYVRALRSRFASITAVAARRVDERADEENWTYLELDTGHNMMLEAPGQTVALLERVA
jgi:pimeloyl-ACP methyl ester carboxylesterase